MPTNNWAIIIGVNQYWRADACLKGAVGDALRMARWLLAADESGVPPGNMYLLASPRPADAPEGVDLRDATADNLRLVINDLKGRSGGEGGRLFFHFSGHGISNFESFRNEQALVMTDFTEVLTDKALKLGPVVQFFGELAFREQFFFIDACRNPANFKFTFETGSTTVKNQLDAVKASKVDQYVLYSTTPGSMSKELLPAPDAPPGAEQGAFTGALLEGLGGDGPAKSYDSEQGDYVVRAEALMDYVIEKVTEQSLIVSKKDPTKPVLIQLPRKGGERSNNNPVLARVPAAQARPESLELFVEPDSVWPRAEVVVRGEDFNDSTIKPVTGAPVTLGPLQPMKYTVRATAPDHTSSKKSFDLYKPLEVTLTLTPNKVTITTDDAPAENMTRGAAAAAAILKSLSTASAGAAAGSASAEGANVSEPASVSESAGTAEAGAQMASAGAEAAPAGAGGPATLIAESSDPLSPLELADSTGRLMRAGQGRFELDGMRPGFYHVRLLTPEGEAVEEVVELSPGEVETVTLSAPDPPKTRLFNDIVAAANFLIQEDRTLEVSKAVGPVSSAQLSTILALAASACNRDEQWGARLKSLGLRPFREAAPAGADCGLQLIAGVESASAEETSALLAGAKLRLWPFGRPVPETAAAPSALSSVVGVAEYTAAAAPGPHWLSVEMGGQRPVVFALTLLPGRLTLLVAHLDAEGRARVFQYAPGLAAGRFATAVQVRRQEFAERFYLSGRLEHAYEIAGEALADESDDPLLLCLRGYLALKLNHNDVAASAAARLTELHERLSDGHVILGECRSAAGDADGAAAAYRAALERGLPVFAEGLTRLHNVVGPRADAGAQAGADPDFALAAKTLAAAAAGRVNGLLWTAWAPGADGFAPGRSLS